MQKMNLELYFTAYRKINSKRTTKSLKLLEENIRVNLSDLGLSNSSLDMTPKAQAMKEKNKLDFIKIKTFVFGRTLS